MKSSLRFHSLFGIVFAAACVVAACSQDLTVQDGDKEIGKSCTSQNDCPFYLACDVGACRQRCSDKLACSSGETCSSRGTCASGKTEPGTGVGKVETVRTDLPADVIDVVIYEDGVLYTAGDFVGVAGNDQAPASVASAAGIQSIPFIVSNNIYFSRSNGSGFELVVANTSLGTPPFTPTVVTTLSRSLLGGYVAAEKAWLVFFDAAQKLTFYDAEADVAFTPIGSDASFSIFGAERVHVASLPDVDGVSSIRTIDFTPNPTTAVERTLRIIPPLELGTGVYAVSGNDEAAPLVDLYTLFPSTTEGLAEVRRYTANLDLEDAAVGPAESSIAPAPTLASSYRSVIIDDRTSWIYATNGVIYRVPYPKAGAKAAEITRTSLVGTGQPVTLTAFEGYVYWIEPSNGKSTLKRVKY